MHQKLQYAIKKTLFIILYFGNLMGLFKVPFNFAHAIILPEKEILPIIIPAIIVNIDKLISNIMMKFN